MKYSPSGLHVIKTLFFSVFCILVYQFSNPELTSDVFNIALVVFVIASLRNKNLLSIFMLILVARLSIELAWLFFDNDYKTKVFVYVLASILAISMLYDTLSKLFLLILVLVVLSEFYWFAIGYDSPRIQWGVFLAAVMLLHRYVFMMRIPWLRVTFKKCNFKITQVDFFMYMAGTVQCYTYMALSIEYLLRHVLNVDVTTVYYLTPNLIHAINIVVMAVLSLSAIKEINLHLFKA